MLYLLMPQAYRGTADLQKGMGGYVVIGSFGNHWPARIVTVTEGRGQIGFTRADGVPHAYSGFEGYALKAVFLKDSEGRETIVVLRSKEKDSQ